MADRDRDPMPCDAGSLGWPQPVSIHAPFVTIIPIKWTCAFVELSHAGGSDLDSSCSSSWKETPHDPLSKRPCPLTQRLAEDMLIRNMAQATIDAYTFHVRRFAQFIAKPLDRVTPEDIRSFQLHLIQKRNLAYSSFNQAVCALRFFYRHTRKVAWPVTMVPYGKRPKKLPTVLSRAEVDELLQCTPNLKHRTFLMTLYAAGLRLAEGTHLRIADVDSQRMQLRVNSGKGAKDRLVPLSPRMLAALREYWRGYRPSLYLFPGKTPDVPYADTSIQKAIKRSARRAGIQKNIHPHVLRHSYATGLLEAGVDLLTISKLLGHASFTTTMVYLHCRREHLQHAPSPLDWLPVRQLPTYQPANESPPPETRSAAPRQHSAPPKPPAASQPPAATSASPPTVAQILRRGVAAYVRQYADGGACALVRSTLAKLSLCRTPARCTTQVEVDLISIDAWRGRIPTSGAKPRSFA